MVPDQKKFGNHWLLSEHVPENLKLPQNIFLGMFYITH